MNKILVISNMFDKEQSILIYKNNQLVSSLFTTVDDMVDTIKGLLSEYSLTEVELVGNTNFLKKYKNSFNTEFSKINVIITSR